MSDSTKDDPHWVKMNRPENQGEPWHNHVNLGKVVKYMGGRVVFYAEECTIDQPVTQSGTHADGTKPTCYYSPKKSTNARYRYYSKGMNYEDRHNMFYTPVRRMEKDLLQRAARDYNSNGDIEDSVILPDYQRGMLGGGYWD